MQQVQTYSAAQFLDNMSRHSGFEFVHFSSPLFSGCEFISRQFRAFAKLFGQYLNFGEVSVELQHTELIRTFEVEQLPTLILLQDGSEVERLESLLSPQELRQILELCMSFYVLDRSEEK